MLDELISQEIELDEVNEALDTMGGARSPAPSSSSSRS